MQKESTTINSMAHLMDDQEQAAWDEFWQRVDELAALMDEGAWDNADWVRAPLVMYRLWRLRRVVKRLNRAFGRA